MQTNGHPRAAPVSNSVDPDAKVNQHQFVINALDRFERPLTAYADRLLGGNLDLARDAVQHTFLQLCKQPPGSVMHKLAPWLYTVCRNQVFDELKKNGRQVVADPQVFEMVDPRAHDPAVRAEKVEFFKRLRQLVGGLNPTEQEIVELWSHGFTAKEISEIIGMAPGTVRVNLHRAIQKLKQLPEVAKWLARATGQVARPDPDRSKGPSASNCSDPHQSFVTGE